MLWKMPLLFNSSLGIKFSPEQVAAEMLNFMRADEKRRYKITIGTDSERAGDSRADFVTAIVIHRVGNGGRYFWRHLELEKIHTLRDRILNEVLISLNVAKQFLEVIKLYSLPAFDFEIHIDIGENGETRSMIQEVVAMVRANNFAAKTKPESYAASNVADRHV